MVVQNVFPTVDCSQKTLHWNTLKAAKITNTNRIVKVLASFK